MARTRPRDQLIRQVWPDKTLYGTTMLVVVGVLGTLQALLLSSGGVTIGQSIPQLVRGYPPLLTAGLSALAAVLGFVAYRRLDTTLGLLGALAGALSLGIFGVGSALSVVAGAFLLWGRVEGEDVTEETLRLGAEEWPDKSLAASMLLAVAGAVTLAWGAAVLAGQVAFAAGMQGPVGAFQVLAGVVALGAAQRLYHQQGAMLGLLAALLSIAALGGYVLGPLLGVAALAFLNEANKEGEFAAAGATPAKPAKPAAARPPTRP